MSSLLSNPNRVGLVTESILTVSGTILHTDEVILFSESSISVVGDSVQEASSFSFVTEVIGNTVPRAGQSYDPNVIAYPDSYSGIVFLITESVGSSDEEGIIGLTWQFGAGAKYGPQPTVGGGGGPGGSEYIHSQASASATWTVTHNLGFKPDTFITSLGGIHVMGEILHIDNNTLQIFFDVPFQGYARCT